MCAYKKFLAFRHRPSVDLVAEAVVSAYGPDAAYDLAKHTAIHIPTYAINIIRGYAGLYLCLHRHK